MTALPWWAVVILTLGYIAVIAAVAFAALQAALQAVT